MLVEAIYDSKVALFSMVLNKLAASNGYMEMNLMLSMSIYMAEGELLYIPTVWRRARCCAIPNIV